MFRDIFHQPLRPFVGSENLGIQAILVVRSYRLSRTMHGTLAKSLIAFFPACMLFWGAVVMFLRGKTAPSFLQLVGAGCLVVVVLAHVCEALHLFPSMRWGQEHSFGHYLDLSSAVLGLTLFPVGFLLHALTKRAGA
jgi:hypothetical protein